MDDFELLAQNTAKSLRKNRENLKFSLLDESVPGGEHSPIRVFFGRNVRSPTNLVRVVPVIIEVQVFHIAFPWIDRDFTNDVILLKIEDQHEIVVLVILLLENERQKVRYLFVLVWLDALK